MVLLLLSSVGLVVSAPVAAAGAGDGERDFCAGTQSDVPYVYVDHGSCGRELQEKIDDATGVAQACTVGVLCLDICLGGEACRRVVMDLLCGNTDGVCVYIEVDGNEVRFEGEVQCEDYTVRNMEIASCWNGDRVCTDTNVGLLNRCVQWRPTFGENEACYMHLCAPLPHLGGRDGLPCMGDWFCVVWGDDLRDPVVIENGPGMPY